MDENMAADFVYFCTDVVGDKHGPLSIQEVQALIEKAIIDKDTPIWEIKTADQKIAEQLPDLIFPFTSEQIAGTKSAIKFDRWFDKDFDKNMTFYGCLIVGGGWLLLYLLIKFGLM